MVKTGLIDKLDQNLFDEWAAYSLVARSTYQKNLSFVQNELGSGPIKFIHSARVKFLIDGLEKRAATSHR